MATPNYFLESYNKKTAECSLFQVPQKHHTELRRPGIILYYPSEKPVAYSTATFLD